MNIDFGCDGILLKKIKESQLCILKKEVDSIKNNFDSREKANSRLVGNIQREYLLSDESIECLDKVIRPLIGEYSNQFHGVSNAMILDEDLPIDMTSSWVNFQKKHEFNPVHRHTGLFSFILWLDIPFSLEDEYEYPGVAESASKCAGTVEWFYTSSMGRIEGHKISVDKTYNNTLALFPAAMLHTVYPFYTSDDYRISVSGNYYLTTKYGRVNCKE